MSTKNSDTATLYKTAKSQLGWNSSGPPTILVKEGTSVTSPGKLAQVQMDYYHDKNKKNTGSSRKL